MFKKPKAADKAAETPVADVPGVQYRVATAHQSALHDLTKEVNALMADGWECLGGIASLENGRVAQALRK